MILHGFIRSSFINSVLNHFIAGQVGLEASTHPFLLQKLNEILATWMTWLEFNIL